MSNLKAVKKPKQKLKAELESRAYRAVEHGGCPPCECVPVMFRVQPDSNRCVECWVDYLEKFHQEKEAKNNQQRSRDET